MPGTPTTQPLRHSHRFDQGNPLAERNTRWAVLLTACMMVAEIAGGWLFNSMALLADGWHMSSHALALGLAVLAYGAARRYANDPRFSFGTWKIEVLGSYTSALLLLLVAGNLLLQLFLSANETAIMADARMFLIIQAVFYFPLALVNIVRFLIQGIGFPFLAILAGVMEMIARTLAAIFLVPAFGFLGSAFASPIAWIMADAFLIPAFFYVYKKLSRQMGTDFEN